MTVTYYRLNNNMISQDTGMRTWYWELVRIIFIYTEPSFMYWELYFEYWVSGMITELYVLRIVFCVLWLSFVYWKLSFVYKNHVMGIALMGHCINDLVYKI